MTKYKVFAYAKNRITGFQKGKIRSEIIDTKLNDLFKDCNNKYDIKDKYEAFWSINPYSSEIIVVLKIIEVKK